MRPRNYRTMKARLAAALRATMAALAFLFAAWPVAVIAQPALTVLGLSIPAQVAGLPHGLPYDYETTYPGLGYSIPFKPAGEGRIDVYVYTLKLDSIPEDPMSELVRNQLAQAKGDVFTMEKRGLYANVAAKSDFTVNDTLGQTRFVCSALTFVHVQSGRSTDSYVCVSSWKNKFLKIRMTTPQDPASSANARRFVEGWIPVLWSPR